MKYFVRVAGQTLEVNVEASRVVLDGSPLEVHLARVPETPLVHLLLGDESWTVAAQPLEEVGHWALGVVGERVELEVVDERTRQMRALTGPRPTGGEATVQAPMPGLVVRIEVAEGQRVDAGAGLLVVEAMKMENELRAPRAGVVQRLHVAAGQAVEKGAPLVTLTSADQHADPRPAPDGPVG